MSRMGTGSIVSGFCDEVNEACLSVLAEVSVLHKQIIK
jgi:hypothetical protein